MTELIATNLLLNFGLGFAGTVFVAVVARWIADVFTSAARARVASFSVALGFALGRYSFVQNAHSPLSAQTASGLGAIVALVGVWFVLFRKSDRRSA